jgi:hypothetical protein
MCPLFADLKTVIIGKASNLEQVVYVEQPSLAKLEGKKSYF